MFNKKKNKTVYSESELIELSKSNHQYFGALYEKYFDTAAAEFTHNLICEHIEIRTHGHPCVIHAHAMPWDGLYKFRSVIDFQSVFKQHRGLINHFTNEGNQIVYNKIKDRLYEQATI